MKRRQFLFATGSALTYPFVARAQSDDLRAAIAKLPQLHSFQVMKGKDLVFAEAVRGAGLDRAANIKSCSKSIVALLLGAAIERGEIESVKATLSAVAPSFIPSNATQGVAEITMENLVSLQAGLERTSGGNYGNWVISSNWVADALTRPMVDEPGGRMLYSTGSTHVLGAALADATGLSLLAQARDRIGAPLGIDFPPWT